MLMPKPVIEVNGIHPTDVPEGTTFLKIHLSRNICIQTADQPDYAKIMSATSECFQFAVYFTFIRPLYNRYMPNEIFLPKVALHIFNRVNLKFIYLVLDICCKYTLNFKFDLILRQHFS